jgi:putative lysine transport system permease protein
MPQIGNNLIINIKDTSVMFIIGFSEFFAEHRRRRRDEQVFPLRDDRNAGYLIDDARLLIPAPLEKKMDGSDSYELVQHRQRSP